MQSIGKKEHGHLDLSFIIKDEEEEMLSENMRIAEDVCLREVSDFNFGQSYHKSDYGSSSGRMDLNHAKI